MTRRTLQGLELRDGRNTVVLAPTSGWGGDGLDKAPWRDGSRIFDSLWLGAAALGELRRFWARQRANFATPPGRPISDAELRREISASIRAGLLSLGVPAGLAKAQGGVTSEQLLAIMPHARDADRTAAVGPLNDAMDAHGIDSAPKRAAFLAQVAVESQELRTVEEGLTYTHEDRLQLVFGRKYFPTLASATPYVRNPKKLANYVYALKNGNKFDNDGWDFRGRGYIQVTGRGNYREVGYENNPDALLTPTGAAASAAAYWESRKLNAATAAWLNRAEFDLVTKKVNSAQLEAEARWKAYQRARAAFAP